MGVYADLLAQKKTFTVASPFGSYLTNLAAGKVDPADPGAGTASNAVHTIAQDGTDHTGGTFTLAITLRNGETFTTAGIAYNANAATIEGAIDTAATSASITGWTNGDITVAGGILQAAGADVTLTFDGTSVAGLNHAITVFDGSSLTGGAEPATRITVTTPGATARKAWAFLVATGVVTSSVPEQAAVASTTGVTLGVNSMKIPDWAILAAAKEAAAEDDNNASYFSLVNALGLQDRAPLVPHTGNASRVSD